MSESADLFHSLQVKVRVKGMKIVTIQLQDRNVLLFPGIK